MAFSFIMSHAEVKLKSETTDKNTVILGLEGIMCHSLLQAQFIIQQHCHCIILCLQK